MSNLAYQEPHWEELLNGEVVAMSPRPTVNHNRVVTNLSRIFGTYLKGKPCEAFSDGVDVFLTDKDRVIPDMMVVCNKDIIKQDGIHGAPDLIVEVLSPSTAKNDKGYKKQLYARCGVKEYWIADTASHSVEVYLLTNGEYVLDNIYTIFPDYVLSKMTEEEKAEIINEFSPSLYPDLKISIFDVFDKLI